MPGFLGIYNRSAAPVEQKDFSFSARYLFNQNLSTISHKDNHYFGCLLRNNKLSAYSHYQAENGITVSLYGHCIDPKNGKQLTGADVYTLTQNNFNSRIADLEGAFTIVIQDHTAGQLKLINDRFSILPVYWHLDNKRFCFAPNLRFLPENIYYEQADATAVIHFLSIGKYPGPRTPLNDVHLLPPATVFTLSLKNFEYSMERYWNLKYESEYDTPSENLVNDLGEAIEQATALFTDHDHGQHGIFLSGGWDSRSILGAALALGRPPIKAITNGKSDQIRYSDTWLAKRLCNDHNIPCLFSRREPHAGPERWQEGLWLSEIATENSPGNFGIHRLPENQFIGLDSILKGDVTWGSGELTNNDAGIINKNFPMPLENNVLAALSPDIRTDAAELYGNAIEQELIGCENDHPADRQQWLWQASGINRYIFGLGYFDEEYIQVRRPLVTKIVLDQWRRVPWRLRIHKNLFLETIKVKYPHLFNYGRNHTSHLANYHAIMAPYIKERALEILDQSFDLYGLLDIDSCRRILTNFNPTAQETRLPGLKARLRNTLHDRHAWRWHRSSRYKEEPIGQLHTSDQSVAFRLYLLLEWFYRGRTFVAREG